MKVALGKDLIVCQYGREIVAKKEKFLRPYWWQALRDYLRLVTWT